MPGPIRIGVLGVGYWGPNLARNLASTKGATLAAVCDRVPERRLAIQGQYPGTKGYAEYDDMLRDPDVDAVVVATPVELHHVHALAALEAGKHVLVEKPLATSAKACLDLVDLAEERGLVLMAGHTFLYNAAVGKAKSLLDSGELGDLLYVSSQRLNLGIVRQDINVMWNLAPHDVSVINHLVGASPLRVAAKGFTYLQHGLPDVAFLTFEYPRGVAAHIHVSWLDPQKVRRMTIVGSRRMLVYDDMSADAKIQLYDKGVDRVDQRAAPAPPFGEFQLMVRSGDLLIPRVDVPEPLRVECAHFVACVRERRRPLSDGRDGLRVVAALEAADHSMALGGQPVDIPQDLVR